MTGFGRAEKAVGDKTFLIDIKSLNGKQFELMLKMPAFLKPFEFDIRKIISKQLGRGSIDCSINLKESGASKPVSINTELAKAYYKPIAALSAELGLDPSAILSTLIKLPEVITPTGETLTGEEWAVFAKVIEAAISDGSGACIYISGTPGTGKTATVREVVAQLNASVLAEELEDFTFVEINGMKVTDPHQSYSLLWEALSGQRVSPSHALDLLEREFSKPTPRITPCVVLMDELDQLVTKNQSVMYNFFNWPGLRHSKLIVLAVANTMDLPERTLSNKISSRLGK